MPGIGAILLAAGESSRMGQLKALLPWRNTTLLEHQLRSLLDAGVQQVVVVVGHDADRLKPFIEAVEGASWALNNDYLQGKTTSLKTGVAALSGQPISDVLLLNVDQPRSAATVRMLLERHQASSFRITIPTHGGKGGHPIFISAELLPELAEIDEGSQGLKAVVRRHTDATERFELNDPSVLWDLNTPEQYQKALEAGI
ncbi:MAG TPA: nucleotidyltransferase family protein [Dehalococcoidia bacterium]|nr:nucleotidyltransferase family protein [Dehalococcoidia bacterium]